MNRGPTCESTPVIGKEGLLRLVEWAGRLRRAVTKLGPGSQQS